MNTAPQLIKDKITKSLSKYFPANCGWLKLVGNHQQKEIIFQIFKNPIESSWDQCLATSSGNYQEENVVGRILEIITFSTCCSQIKIWAL